MTPTVYADKAQQDFFRATGPVFSQVNATMQAVIPDIHGHIKRLMHRLSNDVSTTNSAHANNQSIFPSVTILIDRETGIHRDTGSNANLVETSVTFGDYQGGNFLLPQLGVVAKFGPGSIAIFRGKAFDHGVGAWSGAERGCFVSYVHAAVFDSLKTRSRQEFQNREPPRQFCLTSDLRSVLIHK